MGSGCCKFWDQDESHPDKDEELAPLDKRKIFIEALKGEYTKQCEAVQPIPYIKDRLYSVNKVFVEGGTEIYLNESDTWKRVESYKDVYRDFRATETIHTLEGEAGYGKSTVTLQLAYDWCKSINDSPLANTEILILLKLRQLSGFNSLYQAIKRLLVKNETNISSIDIKDIIESCTSVELLLDGYDEYPEREQDTSSELVRIIRKETLKGLIVSLTTRNLPNELETQTHKRARLLGFDEKSRDQYIRKAVVKGGNKKQIEKIKRAFSGNPVLVDLCQVPLFFVMFAHMTHEKDELSDIKSVTEFFRMMLKCFHSHLRNKSRDENTKAYMTEYEFDHKELSSVAFESLSKTHRHFSWSKQDLRKRLGHGFYQHYIAVGILKEEEVPDSSHDENDESENIDDKTEVRFFHNLFCEWYASFDLIEKVVSSENTEHLHELLDGLDPLDFQYLYRFSCGNNSAVGNKIIQYLKDREGCDKFAILCILEQSGDVDEIEDIVTELCAKTVVLQTSDSKLLQRSVIQLLEIANNFRIPVPHLVVDKSLINMKQDEPAAKSGDILPILPTLENLEVKSEKGRELTETEVIEIVNYGKKHENLRALTLKDALLPLFFDVQAASSTVMTTTFSVFWRQRTCELRLDSQSGMWEIDSDEEPFRLEVDDWQTISQMCKHAIHFRTTDSRQLQRSTILLMETASMHSLSVPSVVLDNTFSVASQSEIELTSGLRVPILSSMKMLEMKTDFGTEFTEQQVLDVLSYGKQCQRMTQISFLNCLVPLYLSNDSLPFLKTMEHINVLWQPSDKRLWFNFASGKWMLQSQKSLMLAIDSIQSLPKICRDAVVCRWGDIEEHTGTLIMLLEIASRHGVPISCLILERGQICTDKCELKTASGIPVPVLTTLQSLELRAEKGTEFTQTDVLRAVTCGQRYPNLEKLTFSNCVLPLTLPDHSFSSRFQVLWKPGERELGLDSSNGKWTLHSKKPITFELDQKNSLSELCAESVLLGSEYSEERTRSLVLLLAIASDQNLPISCLVVEKSQMSPDQSEGIITASGVLVPILETLKSLELSGEKGQELTKTYVETVMSCGQRFQNLEKVTFSNCLLPLMLDDISLGSTAQVFWKPTELELGLDLSKRQWRLLPDETLTFDICQHHSLSRLCSEAVILQNDDSEENTKALVVLLEIASNHGVPISCLVVEKPKMSADQREIITPSGVVVPILTTLRCLELSGEKGQELTKTDVETVMNCGQRYQNLEKLTFSNCLLPLTLDGISRNSTAQVFWKTKEYELRLDFSNGRWRLLPNETITCDIGQHHTLSKLCSNSITIRNDDSEEHTRAAMLLLEIASHHGLPIPWLVVEQYQMSADQSEIVTASGVVVPILPTLNSLELSGRKGQELTKTDVEKVMRCGQRYQTLEKLTFSDCLLPLTLDDISLTSTPKVFWKPTEQTEQEYRLNSSNGKWKLLPDETLTVDLPISCLVVHKSQIRSNQRDIITPSGVVVPTLKTLRSLESSGEKGQELTKTDVETVMSCGERYQKLEKLTFSNCLLPLILDDMSLKSTAQVFWKTNGHELRLDFSNGKWRLLSNETITFDFGYHHSLSKLCSDSIILRNDDSEEHTRAVMLLLEIASEHKVPISSLLVEKYRMSADQTEIITSTGVPVPILTTMRSLEVSGEKGQELDQTDVEKLMNCGQRYQNLEKLTFSNCLLPLILDDISLNPMVQVFWKPTSQEFRLDFPNGKWRFLSDEPLTLDIVQHHSLSKLCSDSVILRNDYSQEHTRTLMLLLEIGSSHDVPISRLILERFQISEDKTEICAASGIPVPILPTLQSLELRAGKGTEFSETDVLRAVDCVQRYQNLEGLTFSDCLLPLTLPNSSLLSTSGSKTLQVQVSWKPKEIELGLDFSKGRWKLPSDDYLTLEIGHHHTLQGLCSESVILQRDDSKENISSVLLLLGIASCHNIPISCLVLETSPISESSFEFVTPSGVRVPILPTLKSLRIKASIGEEFSENYFFRVLSYGEMCQDLRQIIFEDCLLPLTFDVEILSMTIQSSSITVTWQTSNYDICFDFQTGGWIAKTSGESFSLQVDGIKSLTAMCENPIHLRSDDSTKLQRSTSLLLDIASCHNILVQCVVLHGMCSVAKGNQISLDSGVSIPILSSMEMLEIRTELGIEFSEEQVVGVLCYGKQCKGLKQILFVDCLLPLVLPVEPLSFLLTSKDFDVLWRPSEHEFALDNSSCKWKLRSEPALTLEAINYNQSLSKLCSESITLGRYDSVERTRTIMLLLDIASRHNIPISCLILENSFNSTDQTYISTASGCPVPLLPTLQCLDLAAERGTELTDADILKVITFGQQYQNLEKLIFSNCLVTLFLPNLQLQSTFQSSGLKLQVSWKPLEHEFPLDVPSGKWKILSEESLTLPFDDDNKSLSKLCSDTVIIRSETREEHKKAMVLLLEVASHYNIQIQRLVVESDTISGGSRGLKIQPGVWIPALMTLETLEIKTEKGQELKHRTVLELLHYVMKCPQLTKITFIDCLLPLSFSDQTILSDIQSKDLQVFWRPSNHEFCLDDSNGKWEMKTNDQSIWIEYDGDKTLTKLCIGTMFLTETDNLELQKTMILLLEIASTHQIPMSELCLMWSFRGFDGDNIRLESGLCISSLSSVEKITINGGGNQQLSEGEVTGLLNFGLKSRRFKELWFHRCKLPPSINPASIPEEAKSRNAKVFSSNEALSFDLETGEWTEPEDIETITTMCSDGLTIDNRTSESVQRSVIELLVKATNHDIPIYQVTLIWSFDKTDEDGLNIILKSGLLLPNISSMEVMGIQTERGREMKEEEVNGILNYLQQNKRFKKLSLVNCVLPSRIRLGSAADTLRSRNIRVFWIPDNNKFHQQYLLDLTRGHWDKEGSW